MLPKLHQVLGSQLTQPFATQTVLDSEHHTPLSSSDWPPSATLSFARLEALGIHLYLQSTKLRPLACPSTIVTHHSRAPACHQPPSPTMYVAVPVGPCGVATKEGCCLRLRNSLVHRNSMAQPSFTLLYNLGLRPSIPISLTWSTSDIAPPDASLLADVRDAGYHLASRCGPEAG